MQETSLKRAHSLQNSWYTKPGASSCHRSASRSGSTMRLRDTGHASGGSRLLADFCAIRTGRRHPAAPRRPGQDRAGRGQLPAARTGPETPLPPCRGPAAAAAPPGDPRRAPAAPPEEGRAPLASPHLAAWPAPCGAPA